MLENTTRAKYRLHTRKTIHLLCQFLHAYCTFYRLVRYILSCQFFFLFSLENDGAESSKRCVRFVSLVFIIRLKNEVWKQIQVSQYYAMKSQMASNH